MSLDRATTSTSFSLSIDDIDEHGGATGGAPFANDDDVRPSTADDQTASRPTTAAPSRPANPAPLEDPSPANDDEDDSQESINSILKKKLQRKLTNK